MTSDARRNLVDLNVEQESIRELAQRKNNLELELKNYAENQAVQVREEAQRKILFTQPRQKSIGTFSEIGRRQRGPIVAEPRHELWDQRRRRGERGNGGVLGDADHGGDPCTNAAFDRARHQPGNERQAGEIVISIGEFVRICNSKKSSC